MDGREVAVDFERDFEMRGDGVRVDDGSVFLAVVE